MTTKTMQLVTGALLVALVASSSMPSLASCRTGSTQDELRLHVYTGNGRTVHLARQIEWQIRNRGGDRVAVAKAIINYVQGLRYIDERIDPYVHPSYRGRCDNWQFSDETFAKLGGDCEDVAIVAYTMLKAVGIPACFVDLPGHMAVAVNLGRWQPPDGGTYFDYAGGRYWFVECTGRVPIGGGYKGGTAHLHMP